jgi:hypothetical protein
MRDSELLPCPMCGGYAKTLPGKMYTQMIQSWHSPNEAKYIPCQVICHQCGLSLNNAVCVADAGSVDIAAKQARLVAMQKWNTRKDNNVN